MDRLHSNIEAEYWKLQIRMLSHQAPELAALAQDVARVISDALTPPRDAHFESGVVLHLAKQLHWKGKEGLVEFARWIRQLQDQNILDDEQAHRFITRSEQWAYAQPLRSAQPTPQLQAADR